MVGSGLIEQCEDTNARKYETCVLNFTRIRCVQRSSYLQFACLVILQSETHINLS